MIYILLTLKSQIASIRKENTPPLKLINGKDFSSSCLPSKETNFWLHIREQAEQKNFTAPQLKVNHSKKPMSEEVPSPKYNLFQLHKL